MSKDNFQVCFTETVNVYYFVEAENEKKARKKAERLLNKDLKHENRDFWEGEISASGFDFDSVLSPEYLKTVQ